MSLQIGSTVTNGLRRVANRNGLLLVLASVLVGTAWQVAFNSAMAASLPPEVAGQLAPVVDAPFPVLAAFAVVSFLVLPVVSVAAIRTFVAGETDRVPREFVTRRIGWVVANLVVGGMVLGVLVMVGTVLFVVPGIIVYVALLFMAVFVAVEDENFVAAMGDSWRLTRGNWIRLFVLILIVTVPFTVAITALSIALTIAVGPASGAATLVTVAISMAFSIVVLGVIAEAFERLREGDSRGEAGESGATDPGSAPAA
ncbi:hypothetical protein CK500_03745 [Halorubrum salipaludis]|uniref:DUF7847 domain-containing protein n=1 Tax=Halorubrum salipaludis TaxID=2032630 RepID=A0A2A2FI51_9EURY|nr:MULTISPECIES: hypothetical protein [Halorubrum]PAU84638.1 hypothetical protein CK500_03745 [Halorubrum salipaludis]